MAIGKIDKKAVLVFIILSTLHLTAIDISVLDEAMQCECTITGVTDGFRCGRCGNNTRNADIVSLLLVLLFFPLDVRAIFVREGGILPGAFVTTL